MSTGAKISAAQAARYLGSWRRGGQPLYLLLAAALQRAIVDGNLTVGSRLPAERALAEHLQVSRNTIVATYARLRDGGWLASRHGAGTWVQLPSPGNAAAAASPAASPPSPPSLSSIDLSVAARPAPCEAVLEALARLGATVPPLLSAHGYLPRGNEELRALVADRYSRRGLPTTPDQVLLTSGALSALNLIFTSYLSPGDAVITESPTYPNVIRALRGRGVRLRPFPVTSAGGWDTGMLRSSLRGVNPAMAYLIPDYHMPAGCYMDLETRHEIARIAAESSFRLVVDEAGADTGLDGHPPCPPLASFAADGSAISVGSMSKSFWGGLRVGWIRAAARTIEHLAEVRAHIDLASAVLDQALATELLRGDDSVLNAELASRRSSRAALCESISQFLPEWKFEIPGGGLSLWVRLPHDNATELALMCSMRGVHIVPGPRFSPQEAHQRHIRLTYVHSPDLMKMAVLRVAEASASLVPGAARPGVLV
jgi:DNA-binding transcriptional MocR family regulator